MKFIQEFSLFTFIVILIYACGGAAAEPTEKGGLVDDGSVESKKEILQAKKKERSTLDAEIRGLEQEIEELDPNAFKGKPILITVQPVEKKDFEEFTEVAGTIATKGTFNASPEMGGTIRTMNFKEGDNIRSGQLVAKIDNEPYLKQKEELLLQLNLAKDIFQRRDNLWKQKIGSELDYISAKNQVEALEKSLSSLETQVAKANVYAPASGVVEMVHLKQGELAGPGMPILTIINTAKVQVEADVSENYLKSVKTGDKILVEIPALEINREARITNIGSLINPENRTFKIEANISNSDRKLKPNLLAMVKIRKFFEKDALVIPNNSILQNSEGDFVFVVEQTPQGKIAKKIMVELGETSENITQVLGGLTGEETLILEGKTKVKEGSLLTIND